jgi:hypothetical protein
MPFIPLFDADSDCPMVSSNSSSYVIYRINGIQDKRNKWYAEEMA